MSECIAFASFNLRSMQQKSLFFFLFIDIQKSEAFEACCSFRQSWQPFALTDVFIVSVHVSSLKGLI